ncbi:hypothetical protein EKG38_11355 [Shewanella canadensis]|uniref:Uncharacterized protein n=1 Tax=Shewanella canadensis TaxID=271096 RepID=A0A3S0KVR9_9GAMM|nr:hypothetical protein [Shewanella canadensis]RTR38755.1 hypothetical protein EKG38_11355 [Shewanella canadensis]
MEKIEQKTLGGSFKNSVKNSVKKPSKIIIILYGLLSKVLSTTTGLLGRLTAAQKLYLIAILLLFTSENFGVVAIVTVVALTLEFWPLFDKVWHTLSGKTVLLLFYAIIANFAIAGAASVVNEVVGVSTQHFSYTHNFAILLYLPAWVIAMTALAILLLQIAVPFYLISLLLLRPFGVKGLKLINHNHFRFTTMFVRLILASIVLYHLVLIANLDSELKDDLSDPAGVVFSELTDKQKQDISKELENAKADNAGEEEITIGLSLSEEEQKLQEEIYAHVRDDYEKKVRTFIAQFAYHLEADSRSRCQLKPGTNVVELNDYEILEISRDKEQAYGYRFEVKKCISPAFPA